MDIKIPLFDHHRIFRLSTWQPGKLKEYQSEFLLTFTSPQQRISQPLLALGFKEKYNDFVK